MADVNRIFNFLETPRLGTQYLKECCDGDSQVPIFCAKKYLIILKQKLRMQEIKPAAITLKMNSLSDEALDHEII